MQRRFRSKLEAAQTKVPVYACDRCRCKHDAPLTARCKYCNHMTKPSKGSACPNCARPGLENHYSKPFACQKCGHNEFQFFHSTGEFNYFAQLALMMDQGIITELRRQVPFVIKLKGKPPICTYVADFVVRDRQPDGEPGPQRVIDYKPHKDAIDGVFKLKKKLVEQFYPGVTIEVVTP